MQSTKLFEEAKNKRLCPSSWASTTPLLHRRTLILFNELHSEGDGLGFKQWLSGQYIWSICDDWNTVEDDEATAMVFAYRLVAQVWEWVVLEWKNVVDKCSEHIKSSVSLMHGLDFINTEARFINLTLPKCTPTQH